MDVERKRSEKENAQAAIESFRKLITGHEEWLMEKILEYAKEYDYVKYTSTLREAWRLSISGLSEALLAAIQEDHPDLELGPDDEFVGDPIAEFGIIEARRHREHGVSLGMFLGLMKYYRQSYKDMVQDARFDSLHEDYCLNMVERFFDRLEIAFSIEWAESDQSRLIEELQARNRLMTNEKNRYLTIFESHPHMVFILDKDLSGEHLLALINDVLEISRIEAERITLVPITFDPHRLIHDMDIMFRVRTDAKGLQFEVVGTEDLPRYVAADENKLRQVLINLLGNAVKFTEEGGITMRVAVKDGAPDEMRLVMEVEDTGPGIAEDEMDKVFGYFEQTAVGRKTIGGSGLGMAISRTHARMMGGDSTVAALEGEGSTFRFEMELKTSSESDLREKAQERHVVGLASGQIVPRILVVDDKEENRALLVKLLELNGFEVKEAGNGEQAVEVFEKSPPDFIWMDIRMPVMDGLEATRRIRSLPGGGSVKIAALTASAMEEERGSILAAGCDDFVRKHCRESVIFDVMAKHLGLIYLHDDKPDGETIEPEPEIVLSSQQLAVLPTDLHGALFNAVLALDIARTLEVVEEITQQDAAMGAVLRKLAENLEYNRLLTLLES